MSRPEVALSDPNVLFSLWLVAREARALVDRALVDHGISGDEFGIYSLLSDTDDVTPSMLERWMCAPPTTVSSYVKRLEGRGHLSRAVNPDDRRSALLRLTPAGARAHAAATADYLPVLADVVEVLGGDEPAVLAALTTFRQAIADARSRQT